MAVYQRGSKGPEVLQIQQALKNLDLYPGNLDADFGGGTESAVVAFQRAHSLLIDGKVGAKTWAVLFPQQPEILIPAVVNKPLLDRCLELTGAFETSLPPPGCYTKVSGNFDNQGISYGALQWNLGQGSLQPLLIKLNQLHPMVLDDVFQASVGELRDMLEKPKSEQLSWARSVQTPRNQVIEPWKGLFKALGYRQEFQKIQCDAASQVFDRAIIQCRSYGLRTERAVALFFDIITQNGSINAPTRRLIEEDFIRHPPTGDLKTDEQSRLVIIANRRADAASDRWREDVRKRKLTIANGQGAVHGNLYDLEEQYGIKLSPAEGL